MDSLPEEPCTRREKCDWRVFRSLAENLPDNVVRYEASGRIVYVNPAFCRTLGRRAEELLGRGLEGMADAEWTGRYRQIVLHGTATDAPEELKVTLRVASGEEQIHLIRLVSERDADGRLTGTLAVGRDITALERTAAQLHERAEAFRSLAENLPDNIVRYDRQGRVIYVNPALCLTAGLSAEQLVGRGLDDLPDTEWARVFREKVTSCSAGTGPEEVKFSFRTAAGEDQIHQVRFVSERDGEGKVTGILSIGRDITALERAAEQLHERAEAFRALVENSPDAIARFDRQGRRVYANPAVGLAGQEPASLLGRWGDEGSPFHPAQGLPRIVQNVLRLGTTFEGEVPWFTHTGEQRWEYLRVVPEYGSDGTVKSVLAIGQDITQRKEMERFIEESSAELRALAATRETAREEERKRMARDLRDHLAKALSALRLETGAAEPKRNARILAVLDETDRVLGDLIDRFHPVALDRGIGAAIEWLSVDFSRRTGIPCAFESVVPDPALDEIRSAALFRILQDALDNVARHARASRVAVRLERSGIDYRFSVRDDGVGFDPKRRRKKSFGLISMRERALAAGGSLTVSAAPGAGTDVVVLIPVAGERRV